MTSSQNYQEAVEAAKANLEAARGALSRDVAQCFANADWSAILRDKYDVQMLIEHIGEAARSKDWVAKIHASADKARLQSPSRGRPAKSSVGANAAATNA